MAKLRRSVILNVGKDLSYITDGSVKWCGPFGKLGFPGGSAGKEYACNAKELGSIPGFGRSPGGGHGNPLRYSCLEKPHGQRSSAGYSPWGRKELDMTEQLSEQYIISLAESQGWEVT